MINNIKNYLFKETSKGDNKLIIALLLIIPSMFLGVLIPLQVISTGMEQFVIGTYSPLNTVLVTFITYAVINIILFIIFNIIKNEKAKDIFIRVFIFLDFWIVFNFFIFGAKYTLINSLLVFDVKEEVYTQDYYITIGIFLISLLASFVLFKIKNFLKDVLFVLCISIISFSIYRYIEINNRIMPYVENAKKAVKIKEDEIKPIYNFSKNNKNVVVFMLDRYTGKYFERVIENYPEIKEKFTGFTFYPNTISFGGQTTTGSPGLFGGYEYIPAVTDQDKTKRILEKHNESLTVMPKLFTENGYSVVASNLPDINYWDNKLPNPFKDIKNFRMLSLKGRVDSEFINENVTEYSILAQKIHMIQYSLMMVMPIGPLRDLIYNDGFYLLYNDVYFIGAEFLNSLYDMTIMNKKTTASNTKDNRLFIMNNTMVHEPHFLSYDDFQVTHVKKDLADERNLKMYSEEEEVKIKEEVEKYENDKEYVYWPEKLTDYAYYDSCIRASMELTKWFDYLKELGVYDNTRIIVVADHGTPYYEPTNYFESKRDKEAKYKSNAEYVPFSPLNENPLLLVKDFNEKEFKIDEKFMTNADTPYLATKDLIPNAKNPNTGVVFNEDYKNKASFYIAGNVIPFNPPYHRDEYRHETQNRGYFVLNGTDLWDINNWSYITGFNKPICQIHKNIIEVKKDTDMKTPSCKKNLIDYYMCKDCDTIFYDSEGKNVIEDESIAYKSFPHSFTNYVSNNDETDAKHGTMTAYCDYGCGTLDIKGDPNAKLHHTDNIVITKKPASFLEAGYEREECELCGKGLTVLRDIPKVERIELEYKLVKNDGKEKEPSVNVIDSEGNTISNKKYFLHYYNNVATGIAEVSIVFNDSDYIGNKSTYFVIAPVNPVIDSANVSGNKLSIKLKSRIRAASGFEVEGSNSDDFNNDNVVKYDIRNSGTNININNVKKDMKTFRIRVYYDASINKKEILDDIDSVLEGGKVYSDWVEFSK